MRILPRHRVEGEGITMFGAIMTTQDEMTQRDAQVRREALLEAARAVCWNCNKGFHTLDRDIEHGAWWHLDALGRTYLCPANGIHKLLAAAPAGERAA